MQLWNTGASWRTVYDYLGITSQRMLAHAKVNTGLDDIQRKLLSKEGKAIIDIRVKLKKEGRALEDFQDEILAPIRAEAFVWDFLCDGANGDVWRTMAMARAQAALAAAGRKREDLFDTTRLADVTGLGRMATVAVTRRVGEEVARLDKLEGGAELAAACTHAASGLESVARKLERPMGELVVAEARCLRATSEITDAARLEMPRLYGRLLQVLPKPFVEALFPRVQRGGTVDDGDEDGGTDGASGGGGSDKPA